ncbi:hypothetical protein ACQPZ2_10585 [Nocardia pseudovaccinii]|uniref:hypothetical protein n=1 Tax=Nocardia pseudovaccinii TaxID=189540 RepID=UPI003D8EA7A5
MGSLADSAEQVGVALSTVFRRRHPGVEIRIHEADFADPTAGLRSGMADIAGRHALGRPGPFERCTAR